MGFVEMLANPYTTQIMPESTNGRNPSSNGFGVALTVSGAGVGYGAYVIVATSGSAPSHGFVLNVNGVANPGVINRAIIAIAYGSVGSERVVVDNILVSSRGLSSQDNMSVYLPLYVPPNTTISIKFAWQNAIGNSGPIPYADVTLLQDASRSGQGSFMSYQGCDTYGITSTTTNPAGTAVTSGATDGGYGSDFSLGTTTRSYKAVILIPGTEANAAMVDTSYYIELIAGGAIIANYMCAQKASETIAGPLPGIPVQANIASGASLMVSMAPSASGAVTIDWAAYCFY